MNNIIEANKEIFEKEIKEEGIVLVDFYGTWCPPCKALAPIVEEFAKEHTNIKVLKVNVDENQELAINYRIMNVPTLLVIKDGELIKTSIGLISKSEIEELVK
jgi:thioredoxin 1